MKLLTYAIGIIFLINMGVSCTSTCPEDEKIGSLKLTETSLEFFPYQGNQKLIFVSNTGENLSFVSREGGVQTQKSRVSVYKICTEFKYDGQSTYQYFESETKGVNFFSENPDLAINVGLYTSTLRPEKELFYDKLIFGVMGVGQLGRGEIITDVRFTDAYEDSEFNIISPVEYLEQITLNTITYHQVYATESFNNARVYYNKNQGIIGFTTHDSITYNLERIENLP